MVMDSAAGFFAFSAAMAGSANTERTNAATAKQTTNLETFAFIFSVPPSLSFTFSGKLAF